MLNLYLNIKVFKRILKQKANNMNMKKLLSFFSFASLMLVSSLTLNAQERTSVIELKNEADSASYALGSVIVQSGLKSYLTQMGVLADTTEVEDANKLDSIKTANTKNLSEFLKGFSDALNQDKSSTSYNSGIAIGSQLAATADNFSKEILGGEGKFNKDAFFAAFSGALNEEKSLIENGEELIQEMSEKAAQKKEMQQAEEQRAQYATEIAEGEKFMAENKTKAGVVTLPSGLQYKILTKGTGEIPTEADRVKVHYKGTLLDGTVFDSSIDRGEPLVLGVTQVIKGWSEALQLMPVGSKWELYIPYDLAYGSRDQGTIKPFSNLIFEVELLSIEK